MIFCCVFRRGLLLSPSTPANARAAIWLLSAGNCLGTAGVIRSSVAQESWMGDSNGIRTIERRDGLQLAVFGATLLAAAGGAAYIVGRKRRAAGREPLISDAREYTGTQ
jgi:hypothetical protein